MQVLSMSRHPQAADLRDLADRVATLAQPGFVDSFDGNGRGAQVHHRTSGPHNFLD
jgi:hypothetical protein